MRNHLFPILADPHWPPWAREVGRACLAFGIYVALGTADSTVEASKYYWRIISAGAGPVLDWTRHFKGLPELPRSLPANQHSHLILIFALFLVSWRLPLRRRVAYFGVLSLLAVLQDWVAVILCLRIREATSLFGQRGWVQLLPWEYNTIETVWYLVYEIPLQAAPFLLFLLTAMWNSGVKPAQMFQRLSSRGRAQPVAQEAPPPRRLFPSAIALLAVVVFLLAGLAAGAWMWAGIRERDPTHLRTHVLLGNARLSEGDLLAAEDEYRQVVGMGSVDGEAWFRLAQVQARLGKRNEAVAILRKAAWVVHDPKWRDRIQAGLEELGSFDPERLPSFVVVTPQTQP